MLECTVKEKFSASYSVGIVSCRSYGLFVFASIYSSATEPDALQASEYRGIYDRCVQLVFRGK